MLRDRKVTVVGLARSGVAAARLCAREGARVTVTDRSPEAELAAPLAALAGLPVRKVLGGHDEADFEGADLVVVSPGVPLSIAPIQAARPQGRPGLGRGRAGVALPRRRAGRRHHRHQRQEHHHRARRGALRPGPPHLRRRQPRHAAQRAGPLGAARSTSSSPSSPPSRSRGSTGSAPASPRSSTSPPTTSTATTASTTTPRPRPGSSRPSSRATSPSPTPAIRGPSRWRAPRAASS